MRRIKTTLATFYNGAMAWRLGTMKIEKALGHDTDMSLVDVNGYGPTLYWETPEAWITTNWNGEIIDTTIKDV